MSCSGEDIIRGVEVLGYISNLFAVGCRSPIGHLTFRFVHVV